MSGQTDIQSELQADIHSQNTILVVQHDNIICVTFSCLFNLFIKFLFVGMYENV